MTARRYLQLDVFSDRPGAGNPLGVIVDAADLAEADMQALAAWLNLSETIFFLPPDSGADYRIRIFTPRMELPFAGHPSVGAAWAASHLGLASPRSGQLVQQCAAGHLPVQLSGPRGDLRASVRSPRAQLRELAPPPLPAGLAAIATQPAALWNNGPDWWLQEVRDEAALRALQPDFAAIAELPGHGKLAAFALCDGSAGYQVAVRAFAPGVGVPEDPVTGSANALIGACLAAQGRAPGDGRYVASQGRELGRDGRVRVQIDAEGEVWIGGQVQAVIDGQIDW
ncbi:MAG TPA: PhzF family phenazine biosynthesis protein [Stenotrophomonas sp.]|nr:PhzF family phenazine biosynthesis protein [Stenotrophomonas sp.]